MSERTDIRIEYETDENGHRRKKTSEIESNYHPQQTRHTFDEDRQRRARQDKERQAKERRRNKQSKERQAAESQEKGRAEQKTARKKKTRGARVLHAFNVILGVVIAVIVLCIAGVSLFQVKNVKVTGSSVYSDEQIEEMVLTHPYDRNVLASSVMSRIRPVSDIEFVDSVNIRPAGRNTITIEVSEKELYGCVEYESARYAYYDSEGVVTQLSATLLPEVILTQGLALQGTPETGKKLSVDDTSRLTMLLAAEKQFKKREISVQSASFDDNGNLIMQSASIWINLGRNQNLEQKIMRLPYILPYLDGQSGVLHLEDWSEENTDIVFERSSS